MARAKKETIQVDSGDDVLLNDDKDQQEVEIVAESSKSEVKSAEDGVAELKKRLADSEEAQKRLERERNEAVSRAYRADISKDESDRLFIESSLNQVKSNAAILEEHLANAMAAGDAAQIARIVREMTINEKRLETLSGGEQSIREKPKVPPQPLDPVEAFAAQLSPKSAEWVRSHPEFATDERLTKKMIAAHNFAVADGHKPDTDGYFESVEGTLKVSKRAPTRAVQDDDDDERFSDASRSTSGRQTAPAAIPVSRDVSPSGQKQRLIRLTPDQADAAESSQMTHREWWDEHQKILAERRGYAN